MLIYIILMLALAYFFQKEGQKLLAGKSKLLAEFCQDAYATKTALSTLRILCLSSAVSGFWMLIAFLLSILCYSIGFILAMLRLRKL